MYRRSLELTASRTQVNITITKWRLAKRYNKMYEFPHAKLNSVQTVRYGIHYMLKIRSSTSKINREPFSIHFNWEKL
jgi:hypothetical protein